MRNLATLFTLFLTVTLSLLRPTASLGGATEATREELQKWSLPAVPVPPGNGLTPERVELGKQLFFDPRLSGSGLLACASCHNPGLGWGDAMPKGIGQGMKQLGRATPSILNAAYSKILMWDGRKNDLEDQAWGPLESANEMDTDVKTVLQRLNAIAGYRNAFAKAYPGQPISKETVAMALASYERTIVSGDSPFDRWIKGDAAAMTPSQVRGFRVFVDENKGNCAACHQAPNFTDDGFHNIGLKSYGQPDPDMGRYAILKVAVLKGAFKTPSLRNVARTAPYFHDGSAPDLMSVIEHYAKGGEVATDRSPNIKKLTLTNQEKLDLVAFMEALTVKPVSVTFPELP
jgi:cytochrome c peroxidase